MRGPVIYVYQVNDDIYGAGYNRKVCARRGKIVEEWSLGSESAIRHLTRRGSAFPGVYHRVKKLAERALSATQADQDDIDEAREAVLIELAEMPFGKRLKAGFRVIFGRYSGE